MQRAALFGGAAAVPVALAYGILAHPFDLSWGLIIVGLIGGAVIGYAVAQGAFNGRFHLVNPSLRWLAAIIARVRLARSSSRFVSGQPDPAPGGNDAPSRAPLASAASSRT